jgi:hypothetical protein
MQYIALMPFGELVGHPEVTLVRDKRFDSGPLAVEAIKAAESGLDQG